MTTEKKTVVHLCATKAEALKVLRSCRVRAHFRIYAAVDALLPADPEHYVPGGFRGSVQVSRGAAELFVSDTFNERHEANGRALKISVTEGSRRQKWDNTKSAYVDYGAPSLFVWIG